MREIFHFDSMLTPKIITFVYWLILFMVVVSGLEWLSLTDSMLCESCTGCLESLLAAYLPEYGAN